jgi:hypothetical protein
VTAAKGRDGGGAIAYALHQTPRSNGGVTNHLPSRRHGWAGGEFRHRGLWQRVRAGFGKGSNTAGLQRWIQQPVVEQALVALGCGRAVTMDDEGSFGICLPHQWQLTTTTLIWDCDCRFGTMIWDCDCGFGTMIQNL